MFDRQNFGFLALALFTLVLGYYFVARPLVPAIYEGTAPESVTKLVHSLYPRLEVEKHRFDVYFFIEKADQLLLRTVLVALFAFLLKQLLAQKERFTPYLTVETSVSHARLLRLIFYGLVLFFTYDWLSTLNTYQKLKVFYEPVSLIAWFHLPYPSSFWLLLAWSLYVVSLLLSAFNFGGAISGSIAFILFVLLQGYLHSFGKINHEYALLTYLMGLMPFWSSEIKRQSGTYNSWVLQLLRIAAISGYVLAGTEKLLISRGLIWQSGSLGGIFLEKYPVFFSEHSWALPLLGALVIVFQISFVLVPFSEKAQRILLPLGFAFHVATWYWLSIGGILHPWLVGYLFYLKRFDKNK